jgi:hypothetical protein
MQNRLAKLFLLIFISFSVSVSGQKLIDSPLARYNLGILEPAGSFRSTAMGGIGTAIRDNSTICYTNPASFSSLDTNSFVFDFGMDYGINIISDGTSYHKSDDMNFDHFMIGFPITKGLGVAAGILPLSNGYYSISETVAKGDPGYDAVTGGYTGYHIGGGNLSNVFLGSGINLTKNISAGINLSLLFGQISRANEFVFADFYNEYHDNISEALRLTGINLEYGLQYSAPIKKDYFFNAGLSYSAAKHCKSNYEKLSMRFTSSSVTDTLAYISDDTSKAYLPGTLRLGISFGKRNKLTAGFDYVATNWSNAKFHGSDGYASNTRAFLFGVEYIPDKYSNYSFMKRIEYRMGGHVEDNYLVLNGQQVKEWGASLGFGIPLRRSGIGALSKTNIFFDFTRKSYETTSVSHYENYFTMGASLNFYDFWFVKRKYD